MSERFKFFWSLTFLPLWTLVLTLTLAGERSPWWGGVAVFFITVHVNRLVTYAPPRSDR